MSSQGIETQVHEPMPHTESANGEETIQHRLIREEREDAKHRYSPKMSKPERDAFLAHLHQQETAWDTELTATTDSVPIIREMRAARTKHLMRRGRDARRD